MANETMNLNTPILTLDSDTVLETAQSKADLIWHDIQNAYRTRKILTGILGGIEKTEAGSLIAIIYFKLDIENPIIRINTAFKGCSSLEKISVLPRIYHN